MLAKSFGTPTRKLLERHRMRRSAANVVDSSLMIEIGFPLFLHQWNQVQRVQQITNLVTGAAKSGVFQRSPAKVGILSKN